jgi:hypothetical protein
MILPLLAFVTSVSLQPDAALRIVSNDSSQANVLLCGRAMQLAPRGVMDIAQDELCETPTIESSVPIVALEIDEATQRVIGDAECAVPTMAIASFACPGGSTFASVPYVEGATYTWTVEGAVIVEGAGTNRVLLTVGAASNANVEVAIDVPSCRAIARGVISIREPLTIVNLGTTSAPASGKPVVLTWSYADGASPRSQMLVSEWFDEPVHLPADVRTYTFTPQSGGTKPIELRASYAVSMRGPSTRRRRATASTLEPAVTCPAALSRLDLEVVGCAMKSPHIFTERTVFSDDTFKATTNVEAGETVEWTVANASIVSRVADGSCISVRASRSGVITVTVRKSTSGCTGSDTRSIPIIARVADCPATPPSASLSIESADCDSATLRVNFTGTPPFSGSWSDDVDFGPVPGTTTRRVTAPGTYSLRYFHDSSCLGTPRSIAFAPVRPTVKLTQSPGSCGKTNLTATFTGTPPFSAMWSKNVPIRTSSYTADLEVESGRWQVYLLQDSFCKKEFSYGQSNEIDLRRAAPGAYMTVAPLCVTQPGPIVLSVSFGGGPASNYAVEWTDGVINRSTSSLVDRTVPMPDTWEQAYEIKHAWIDSCEVPVRTQVRRISILPKPEIDPFKQTACVGENLTAGDSTGRPPSARVLWTLPGATFSTPRTGSSVTFTSAKPLTAPLRIEVTSADGACSASDERVVSFVEPLSITSVDIDRTTIKAGGKVTLTWRGLGAQISLPSERAGGLTAACTSTACSATLYDTTGPGTFKFGLVWYDCGGSHQQLFTVTVTP